MINPEYLREQRPVFFIDAIEDSEILITDLAGHLALLENVPCYAASFHAGIQKRGVAKDKRIVHALSATAEERYINRSKGATAYACILSRYYTRNAQPHP